MVQRAGELFGTLISSRSPLTVHSGPLGSSAVTRYWAAAPFETVADSGTGAPLRSYSKRWSLNWMVGVALPIWVDWVTGVAAWTPGPPG